MTTKHLGKVFGKLTVIGSEARRSSGGYFKHMLQVRCSCGKEYFVQCDFLTGGKQTQCKECRKAEHTAASSKGYKHPVFRLWWGVMCRCYQPTSHNYKYYGARGVTVCDRWRGTVKEGSIAAIDGFHAFLEDMGSPPPGTSIDRIDVGGPYSPENCRWADTETQANNKRDSRRVTVDGVTKTIAQWGRVLGSPSWAAAAEKYGVPLEKAARICLENPCSGRRRWKELYGLTYP